MLFKIFFTYSCFCCFGLVFWSHRATCRIDQINHHKQQNPTAQRRYLSNLVHCLVWRQRLLQAHPEHLGVSSCLPCPLSGTLFPQVSRCSFIPFRYLPKYPCIIFLLQTHHLTYCVVFKHMFAVCLLSLPCKFRASRDFIL